MNSTTETVSQDASYRQTTKTTQLHTWNVMCEQYAQWGDNKGKREEQRVMITCGNDSWARGEGFSFVASSLSAKGILQLAQFLMSVVPHMEQIESERSV